jgi:hypothetical protein
MLATHVDEIQKKHATLVDIVKRKLSAEETKVTFPLVSIFIGVLRDYLPLSEGFGGQGKADGREHSGSFHVAVGWRALMGSLLVSSHGRV